MQVSCEFCTSINEIKNIYINNYCNVCQNLIYKPTDDVINFTNKEKKIEENYLKAYEEIPQSFFPAKMIFLNAKINNTPIKFLVDTGAQISLLPFNVVECLNLKDLIDEKYKGTLKGVGNDKIIGKIHYVEVFLEGGCCPLSFTVCKNNSIEPILGIDMMKQLGLKIDFSKRKFIFNNKEFDFIE